MRLIQKLYEIPIARVNGLGKGTFQLRAGVLQGDPLSPLLFAIYIGGLPTALRNLPVHIDTLLYADDVTIIADSRAHLNRAMKELSKFCDQLDMMVNITKTKVLEINVPNPPAKYAIFYEGERLQETMEFTYLGFRIDSLLSTAALLKHAQVKARIQSAKIKRWFADCKKIHYVLTGEKRHTIFDEEHGNTISAVSYTTRCHKARPDRGRSMALSTLIGEKPSKCGTMVRARDDSP